MSAVASGESCPVFFEALGGSFFCFLFCPETSFPSFSLPAAEARSLLGLKKEVIIVNKVF